MILRRIITHFRKQEWTAIAIDLAQQQIAQLWCVDDRFLKRCCGDAISC